MWLRISIYSYHTSHLILCQYDIIFAAKISSGLKTFRCEISGRGRKRARKATNINYQWDLMFCQLKKPLKSYSEVHIAAFDPCTGLPFVPVAVQPAEGKLYMT